MAEEHSTDNKVTKAEAKARTEPKPKPEKTADHPAPKHEAKPKAAEAKPKAAETKPKAAEAKPKATEAKPKAAEAKPKEEGEKEPVEIVEGEIEKEEAEKKRAPRIKPELDQDLKWAIKVRKERKAKEPEFRRQEWFRYKRLQKTGYRKPRGMHSKMRMHWKYRPSVVRIGFRGPASARGLHSSGFKEILVHNESALTGIDPKTQAIRIGHSVGGRKRQKIQEKADELGIRVLNRW